MLFIKYVSGLAMGMMSTVFFTYVEAQSISKDESGRALSKYVYCSEVKIEYTDDEELTKAEKISLMDRELLRSLSKFDNCTESQLDSNNSANNSSSGGFGNNTDGGSVASSDMSGTEKQTTDALSSIEEGEIRNTVSSSPMIKEKKGRNRLQLNTTQSLDNGKIPEDLINADNDSVLQAQIRQAAVSEKDPKVRARLWNEYRKYKGKPTVE